MEDPAQQAGASAVAQPALDVVARQAQVKALLEGVFERMEAPATLEFKDLADGSMGVAVQFSGEPPQGVVAGKKSYFVDSLQFLVNKCVNRPNTARKWVSLGVGSFPEPRLPKPQGQPQPQVPAPAAAAAPPQARANAPKAAAAKPAPVAKAAPPPKPQEPDEKALEVKADPAMTKLGKALVEKAVKFGKPYGVLMLSADDRARLLKAAKGDGATVKAEGEAHLRRLAIVPAKVTPMPKKNAMPVDDE